MRLPRETLMLKPPIAAALSALIALAAAAQDRDVRKTVERDLGADHFIAGCPVRIERAVAGDAFAAGCSVDVDAAVEGDALAAGGNVRIGAPIGQTLYAAGGNLTVSAPIGRSARIAGGQVEIGPKAQIGGNVTVGGGDVRILGAVRGYVRAAGGRVLIDGPVDGDVLATSGTLELGPNARIGGKLTYASREDLARDAAAQVKGGVERLQIEGGWPVPAQAQRSLGRRGGWVWSIGLMVIAGLLVAAWPAFQARVSEALRRRAGMSLLLGFVALVCIPAAALILLFTIIGVPLALITVALYLALLLVAYVSTGIGLGDWALARFAPARASQRMWRIAAAVLGMLALSLLGRVPYLGGFIVFVALLLGLGALALQVRRTPAAA
jgi:cytoskeletal protein CcmA (bactofilin family)